MRNRHLSLLAVLVAMALAASPALAQGRPTAPPRLTSDRPSAEALRAASALGLFADGASWQISADRKGQTSAAGDGLLDKSLILVCRGDFHLYGSLPAPGSSHRQPVASGYSAVFYLPAAYAPGELWFCLYGADPHGDYDLVIERWQNGGWVPIAVSASFDNMEILPMGYVAGYYRAVVIAFAGSGDYLLDVDGRLLDLSP